MSFKHDPNPFQIEPVILRRKATKAEEIQKGNVETVKKNTSANKQNTQNTDMRKIENEEVELLKSTHDMSLEIQNKRKELNLTQKEANDKCQLPPNTINKYENMTAIINQNELTKINKGLGLKLKKPKSKAIPAPI